MGHLVKQKSDLYIFAGYVLLALAVAFNQFTVSWYQDLGLIPVPRPEFLHVHDMEIILPWQVDILFIVTGVMIIRAPRHLRYYLNDSLRFNLFLVFMLCGIILSSNVILPGKLRVLRILLILLTLFILTNSFYLAAVKKRPGKEVHATYKNIFLSFFAIMVIVLLLEGIFMFVLTTHRFNGTLASRSWFIQYWELNSEGYRDKEYDKEKLEGKKKLLVLGDSFVAGHGVKDPADRFSDKLGQKLSGSPWEVMNLGVGGSDVRDAVKRLKEFPYKPDLLIFSYFPNDIENDGELGGLTLQRARSYADIGFPFRYFIRRSYFLNHIYWRFPHADELSDYKGYVEECYATKAVMDVHKGHLDQLKEYADSLEIPMVAVVFPFLENAEWSEFATVPIVNHFRENEVPVLDLRPMLLGKSPDEFIVNRNDPHPNAYLHGVVADSLHAILAREAYIGGDGQ